MSASTLLMVIAAMGSVSCSNADKAADKATPAAAAEKQQGHTPTTNIRYVDSDTLMAKYNFAKDFQEAAMRAASRIDAARQAKGAEIQKFAAAVEQKARSNGYLTEASYNADMQKLQKMQQDAESYLANLSRNSDNELQQMQTQMADTIEKFVKNYNVSKGYDAILYKNAGIYFNPSLDITKEIVEGLNANYNKVDKKK